MYPADSARNNAGHDRNGIDSEPTSSGYLLGAIERLTGSLRPTPRDEVTGFFADEGQTFALESSGEREWMTADADSVCEVTR